MTYFVGLDWGTREHALCAVDERGAVVMRFAVAHGAKGLDELVARLRTLAPPSELRVAIERPSGLLVDTLVESGFVVVPIHPNALKSTRTRYAAAPGKTDLGDAYVLADVLRTDGHRFHALTPLSDETKALRGLSRLRQDLVDQRVALANQLRSLLEQFWPGAAVIFSDVDSAIALHFLEHYPTPQAAARLGERRLATFLVRHGYAGRRSSRELLDRLRAAPHSVAGERETETKRTCVLALVAVLRALVAQIAGLTTAIEHAVEVHADAQIVTPLFRRGRLCAATLLAELGDDRGRFVSADHLAAEGGAAPVTRASGTRRAVSFRWACNMRLRSALVTLADTTRHTSPWAHAIYQRARDRGCAHAHAIGILARAWCRVIWHCWQNRVAYDPSKHRAAHQLALHAVEQEAA